MTAKADSSQACENDAADAAKAEAAAKAAGAGEVEPGDFYFEGPYMVFTAAYHLKRGYCCNSDCRHCPYR